MGIHDKVPDIADIESRDRLVHHRIIESSGQVDDRGHGRDEVPPDAILRFALQAIVTFLRVLQPWPVAAPRAPILLSFVALLPHIYTDGLSSSENFARRRSLENACW